MDSTGFKVMLLIHVLSAVVAFGGNFIQPMLQRGGADNAGLAKVNKLVQLPALVLMFLAGSGAVGMSDKAIQFSATWVSLAFVVAIIACVLQYLVARAYESDNTSVVAPLAGGLHLCLVVGLILMIWQPS